MPPFDNSRSLELGQVIFYERFKGAVQNKNRWFIVVQPLGPLIGCFTTTTQEHYKLPRFAKEFFEIKQGECCLPKLCYLDFRELYTFDDIELGSRIRSGSVRKEGFISKDMIRRIHEALTQSKVLERSKKQMVLTAMSKAIAQQPDSSDFV